MIPLHDNIPSRSFPVVNVCMIGLTVLAFLAQVLTPEDATSLIEQYGMIPLRVFNPEATLMIPDLQVIGVSDTGELIARQVERPAAPSPLPVWLTLLTCVFLHGGWMHLIGNMWSLWIFGDNVEDSFGRFGYLIFYLAGGIAASATHLLTNGSSPIPTIGASGAVAAVMGGYFVLYPKSRVLTLFPPLFMFVIPATWFLGIWFVMQLWHGSFSLANVEAAGVAWWAHIGGFAVGFVMAKILARANRMKPRVEVLYPNTERLGAYRPRTRRWHG